METLAGYVLSEHARKRSQQRGIGTEVIDAVAAYGTVVGHRGAKKYFMDKKARARARRGLGPAQYRRIADRLDTYIVVADATIITVAKLSERIKASKPHKTHRPRRRRRRF